MLAQVVNTKTRVQTQTANHKHTARMNTKQDFNQQHNKYTEAEKFYDKGNKAAGTRLRKGLQEIKNLSQEIRINVSEMKKTEAVS